MKKIASLSRILEGIIMNTFPRRTSLMAIVLTLSALSPISLSAAEVTYPQPNPTTDTVLVTGVAPTTVTAGQVKIGGGVIRAGNSVVVGNDPQPGGTDLLRVGGAINATSFNLQIGGTSGYWNGPNMYGPNAGNFTIRSGNSASSLRLGGNSNSDHVMISSTGNVGIGTTTPTGKLSVVGNADVSGYLSVNRATANGTLSTNALSVNRITGTTQSVTSYDKAIYGSLIDYAIPSGAVDSGYKIGVDGSGYSSTSGFQGTLRQSFGVWARAGIHQSGASARILDAYAVYAELLSNAGTINNGYGVYIQTDNYTAGVVTNRYDLYAASPTAKNYFAGKVGIGITDPQNALSVAGTISAKEIKVTTTGADYVFADTYRLRPLMEVEQFIKVNRHLPEIPSAKVMQQDGMGVSEIVTKQLAKIEELTLYAIAQKKETEVARAEVEATRTELNDLKSRMERLEKALANR